MKLYTADFETTTEPDDCRVWAYALCDIETEEVVEIGDNIEDFLKFCAKKSDNPKIWFHNLKFDGSFIIDHLLRNGYRHVKTKEEQEDKTFTTLISDKGLFYSIEIIFSKTNKKVNKVTILDSLKLLTMSVEEVAKAFHMSISKLKIDYKKYRPVGYKITDEEKEYISIDVKIMARALKYLFSKGMTKMTTAGNALANYKQIVGNRSFDRWFPKPSYDAAVRQSYKGGFTYVNPKYQGKELGEMIVLDVNSLYPSVMYYEKLPYGEPIYYKGQYKKDPKYPLYVQMITACFELKPDHIPTIQLKKNAFFSPTEYISSSKVYDKKAKKWVHKEITMCLTSVDLELFLDHYDVLYIEYIEGYMFKGAVGFFKDYIDKWSSAKIQAKKEKNHGLYLLSKVMLNGLYGKFAVNPIVRSQYPELDPETDRLKFEIGDPEEREPIYIPMGSFITAYARNKTIRSAQKVYDRFVYADTDSLHLIGRDLPEELEIDSTKLGAWDHESTLCRAKYLRAKCYVDEEIVNNENQKSFIMKTDSGSWIHGSTHLKITCAGMPTACYEYVTFDNFQIGARYQGKKVPRKVPGGVVLEEIDFTIRKV